MTGKMPVLRLRRSEGNGVTRFSVFMDRTNSQRFRDHVGSMAFHEDPALKKLSQNPASRQHFPVG
ncbi:hypothetical protein ACFL2Q_14935, partial [Thermodesulfobacteriota bacterium]